MNSLLMLAVAAALLLVGSAAETFVEESFAEGWESRWVVSDWKKDQGLNGKWIWSAGAIGGEGEDAKGAMTSQDARFYAMSLQADKPFDNRDRDLVVQFSVKFPQGIDCAGGYLKLFPKGTDQSAVSGDTEYNLMFGPDICGSSTKKTHVIFNYKGKNVESKKHIPCESDRFSHMYTLIIHPDNTYEVRIDGEKRESGSLYEDWDMLPPKMIKDPEASKPADWVDEEFIDDPDDVKPADWDNIPKMIPDPDADVPEDWDEEVDGEWEAPKVANPEYKGEWKPRSIPNPEYKGEWEHPMIPNPDFKDDKELYLLKDVEFVGFELWQVKSGSVFDNILVTDSVEEAEDVIDTIFTSLQKEEKAAAEKIDAEVRRLAEEERKKAEAEKEAAVSEDEDEDEDDEDDDEKAEL